MHMSDCNESLICECTHAYELLYHITNLRLRLHACIQVIAPHHQSAHARISKRGVGAGADVCVSL